MKKENLVEVEGAGCGRLGAGAIVSCPRGDGATDIMIATDEGVLVKLHNGYQTELAAQEYLSFQQGYRVLPPGTKVTITVGGAS